MHVLDGHSPFFRDFSLNVLKLKVLLKKGNGEIEVIICN